MNSFYLQPITVSSKYAIEGTLYFIYIETITFEVFKFQMIRQHVDNLVHESFSGTELFIVS